MIFGICGPAGSGKNTVSALLKEKVTEKNIPFLSYEFGWPVKRAASEMFNIPLRHFYNRKQKEQINEFWGMSPRYMMQMLGTEGGRDLFREDIWIQHMLYYYENSSCYENPNSVFIVSDVRFPNEAETISEMGGVNILVRRKNSEEAPSHKSEYFIENLPYDYVLNNN